MVIPLAQHLWGAFFLACPSWTNYLCFATITPVLVPTRPLRLAVRISGSHPEDRGFESRRGHQQNASALRWGFLLVILAENGAREAGTA